MAKIPITIDQGGSVSETKMVDIQGNSNKAKNTEEPKVRIRKESAKTGLKEDLANIASYVFTDIFMPMMRDIIYRVGMSALSMGLYGSDKYVKNDTPWSKSNDRERYSRISTGERGERIRSGGRYNFSRIEFKNREDARDALDYLREQIDQYDDVSVSDFYKYLDLQPEYTDRKYGWCVLKNVEIIPTREGFILDLPKPILLDD